MFEQSLIETGPSRLSRSVAASLAAQLLLVGALTWLPLIFYYRLPVEEWVRNSVLLAPPPPPPPPRAPAPEPVEKLLPKERYERALKQPAAIPDRVALLDEQIPKLSQLDLASAGALSAGFDNPFAGGVPGMNALPLPDRTPPRPMRVGGQVQAARVVSRINPVYPPEAIQQQISGVVLLDAIIARDGTVRKLRLIEGDPLLAASAMEAVGQWRYHATRLNGEAVEVVTQIAVNFNLQLIEVDKKGRVVKKKKKR